VIAYGIEAVLGELVKLLIFTTIGILFNCMIEIIVLVISYGILRASTGGPHCSSYLRCLLLGIMTFTPLAILAARATTTSLAIAVIVSVLLAAYAIFKYVPGEWHQRKLKKPKEVYQNAAIVSIIVLVTITIMMLLSEQQLFLNIGLAIQLAIIWQLLSITPLGYKLILMADQFMIDFASILGKGGANDDDIKG
jgi:accessory gene regulator B